MNKGYRITILLLAAALVYYFFNFPNKEDSDSGEKSLPESQKSISPSEYIKKKTLSGEALTADDLTIDEEFELIPRDQITMVNADSVLDQQGAPIESIRDLWAQIPQDRYSKLYFEIQALLHDEDDTFIKERILELESSDNADDQLLAIMLRAELNLLGDEALDRLLEQADKATLWNARGFFEDFGFVQSAVELATLIEAQQFSYSDLMDLLNDDRLISAGEHAVLEALRAVEDKETLVKTLPNLALNERLDYSSRMKIILMMRDVLPFIEYRAWVNSLPAALENDASATAWNEGTKALKQRLAGPLPLVSGPLIVNKEGVDLIFNQPYNGALEDLMMMLEHAMSSEKNYIQEGVGKHIQSYIAETINPMVLETDDPRIRKLTILADKAEEFATKLMRYDEELVPLSDGNLPKGL